jgi:hypothetical protein
LGGAINNNMIGNDNSHLNSFLNSSAHYLRLVIQHSSVTNDDRMALALTLLHIATGQPSTTTTPVVRQSSNNANNDALSHVREATRLLITAARDGHIDSCLELSAMYYVGYGTLIAKSHPSAMEYARLAANSGDPRGLYQYGLCLRDSASRQSDSSISSSSASASSSSAPIIESHTTNDTAMTQFRAAATAGYHPAIRIVAETLASKGDTGDAVHWWLQIAEHGTFEDQCSIASFIAAAYAKGWKDQPADHAKAVQVDIISLSPVCLFVSVLIGLGIWI